MMILPLKDVMSMMKLSTIKNNDTEEQVGSESNQNPQRRKRKKSRKKSAHGSKVQRDYINGKLSSITFMELPKWLVAIFK